MLVLHFKYFLGAYMSNKEVGKIVSLFISKIDSSERISKETLKLDAFGIKDDKYHKKNIARSVLITSASSYKIAKRNHIAMPFGSLGENLLIDYNPYHLSTGAQLKIGTVILQISQNCTMCDHLSNIDKQLPELLKHDRGIFAKVIQEGEIKKEDKIYLIKNN